MPLVKKSVDEYIKHTNAIFEMFKDEKLSHNDAIAVLTLAIVLCVDRNERIPKDKKLSEAKNIAYGLIKNFTGKNSTMELH